MSKKVAIAVLFALFALPFLYLTSLSLATEWRFPALLPEAWTAAHWTETSAVAWGAEALTAVSLAVLVGALSSGLGFLCAWQLSAHPLRRLWLTLAYLPYVYSPVIYAYCVRYFFNIFNLSGTYSGVLVAQFILTFPFSILLYFNHFDDNIRAMEELTYTLGGSPGAALRRVLLPISKPVILLCFFQTFLISWFEYGLTSVIGLGQVRTLTIAVYQYIGEANPYVSALASCLVCLPPLILLWFNQRFVFKASH